MPVTRPKEPPEVRRRRILELVGESDFIRPAEIAVTLDVSAETIRRDLLSLERSGRLRRVHGGAVAEKVSTSEPDRASRTLFNQMEKREIAAIVVSLIGPRDAIFLDVGTTVEEVARALPSSFGGTVITNSILVGSILGEHEAIDLHILGGKVRMGEFTTYGADTLAQIEGFHTDFAFIGAGGVHPDHGLTDYSPDDVATKRAMVAHSRSAYIVAGSEKLTHTALRFVCPLEDVAGIITDSRVTQVQREGIEEAGTPVLHPA